MSEEEVWSAVRNIKKKVINPDGVLVEVWIMLGNLGIKLLTEYFNNEWMYEVKRSARYFA